MAVTATSIQVGCESMGQSLGFGGRWQSLNVIWKKQFKGTPTPSLLEKLQA